MWAVAMLKPAGLVVMVLVEVAVGRLMVRHIVEVMLELMAAKEVEEPRRQVDKPIPRLPVFQHLMLQPALWLLMVVVEVYFIILMAALIKEAVQPVEVLIMVAEAVVELVEEYAEVAEAAGALL